jgi:hypothetical protein
VLLENGVEEGKILFLTVIAAPEGIRRVCGAYPRIKVLTSEIDEGVDQFHIVPGELRGLDPASAARCSGCQQLRPTGWGGLMPVLSEGLPEQGR